MPIPTNISNNAAEIYEASLLYEQNCKCGTTEVLIATEGYAAVAGEPNVWKIVAVQNASALSGITANNISIADCAKLTIGGAASHTFVAGAEIMADITALDVQAGVFILYKDCSQS